MRQYVLAFTVVLLAVALAACQAPSTANKPPADRGKLSEINAELGAQYMRNREYQTAMEKLTKAVELNPRNVNAHGTLALLHAVIGQYDKAEASFKQALRIDGDNSAVLNNFGQFLCQRGRFDEGQKLILKAVANPLYPNAESGYYNAGACAMGNGKLDEADGYFRKALEINSQMPPALLQMADLSLQLDRALQARAYLQRYSAIATMNARALWLGVQIERRLGNRDDEASYALQLQKNFPDSQQTKQLLESKPQ
ncbi:MAG: type IV pilus biogenesis/stability protein PilW [Proteobacteria bacterium]|nr:type IV pilus biogenesis/stability protein PilW [Pseudomonadota bacterium]